MIDSRTFVFSQTALRSYQTCPRQFKLRYLDHLKWPAEMGTPQLLYEKLTREGALFHKMASQYFLGIPAGLIEKQIDPLRDANVFAYWQAFLSFSSANFDLEDSNKVYKPEYSLRGSFAGFTVEAKFDLLVIDKLTNQLTIYDWKTTKHGRKSVLNANNGIQTMVYLATAKQFVCSTFPSDAPDPKMIYCFAGSSGATVEIIPTLPQFEQYENDISILIDRTISDEQFELTENIQACGVCPYRAYCGRIIPPTSIQEENILELEEPFPWDVPSFE